MNAEAIIFAGLHGEYPLNTSNTIISKLYTGQKNK